MLTPRQINQLKKVENPAIRRKYSAYFQLPKELNHLFFDEEIANKMRLLAEKNSLNKNQLWWASHTAGMIILGETNIIDFVKTLKEKCKLTEEPARQLARDINQTIFLPVKESLKKVHQITEWPRGEKKETQINNPQLNGNIVDLKGK